MILKDIFRKKPANRRHQRNIESADRISAKLSTFQEPFKEARQLTYLRKINPYIFEELLLTLLKEQGHDIIRNKSYSNDGGLDGKIQLKDGRIVLIQAKRYTGHVNNQHMKDFSALIKTHRAAYGYFMHTGRTSKANLSLHRDTNLVIYSGSKLLGLLSKAAPIEVLKPGEESN